MPASGAAYTTPNTGVNWTIQQLAVNSSGTVTYSGSVFYIHDMLTVSVTDTLVIPPGSILKVDKDKRIDIKGRLYAVGTPGNTIEFTSNLPSPKPGDWKSLRLNDAKSNSILKHAIIGYAYDGVYIYKGSAKVESNEIHNISFRGVYCREDSANVINNTIHRIHNPDTKSIDEGTGVKTFNSYAFISSNRIYDIQTSGVKLDYSDATVYNNNISQSRYGINVFRSEPKLLNNTIWNNSQGIVLWENVFVEVGGNLIVDNIELGIYFHRTSPDIHHNTIKSTGIGIKNYYTYDNVTIRDNNILLNEVSGITLDGLNNVVIENNYIWHNFYEPIYGKQMTNLVIKDNIIERNEDDGIQLVDCTDVTIDGNTIDDVRGGNGIYLDNTKKAKLYHNTIKDAGFNSIKFVSSTIFSMRHNEILSSHQKDVWLDDTDVIAVNLSFDRSNVKITTDSELLHKNLLTVKVQDNYQTPILDANVTVKDNGNQIYKLQTDNYGEAADLLLSDLIYEGKDTYKDNVTTVFVDYGSFVFDNNPRTVNMFASHIEVFGRNRLPEIHITKPDNKQEVSGSIFINGTAFDPDGLIQSVEVSFDNTTWHQTTAKGLYWSKWSYVWNSTDVVDGDYFIFARVFDMLNYSFDSVLVTVNNGQGSQIEPIIDVLIYSPFEYQVVRGEYPIFGTAFSTFGDIISVEIKIDNGTFELATPGERTVNKFNPEKSIYEDVIEPDWSIWGYEWNTTLYNDGEHTIKAKALDLSANLDFIEVTVVVDNLKSDNSLSVLEIEKPTDGQVLKGASDISGKYWGQSYATPLIQLKIGLEGNWFKPNIIQWYDWWLFNSDWDTTLFNDGIYEIFVKVKALNEELLSSKIAIVNNGGGGSDFGMKITTPVETESINGTFNVEGYVWNYGITIQGIEIRVDNNQWEEVVSYELKHISDDDGEGGVSPEEPEGGADIYWVTWEYPLDTRPFKDGIHVIGVKSYDSVNTTFSSVTVIFVNGELTPDEVIDDEIIDDILDIDFTTPKNGAIVSDSVTIQGMAWSHFGNISSVEVQIDELGFIPATASSSDWSVWEYTWDTTIHKNGIHTLSARVNAEVNVQSLSKTEVILVIINNQVEGPGQSISEKEIIILHPEENDILSGTVELYGIGWINNGTIKEVQLQIDNGVWLQAEPTHTDWLTWSYMLNTSEYLNGHHTLTGRLNTGDALVNTSMVFFINNTKGTDTTGPDDKPDDTDSPKPGDNGGATSSEKEEANDVFIQALTFAIVLLVVFLIIISFFIFKLQKKPSKDSGDDLDEPSKDSKLKSKGKEKDLGGDLSRLETRGFDDDRIEIESDIFDEDEDDEIIVIRGEVLKASPKPPTVSAAPVSKSLETGIDKKPALAASAEPSQAKKPGADAVVSSKPKPLSPSAVTKAEPAPDKKADVKGDVKVPTPAPVPKPVPVSVPVPVPSAVPSAKSAAPKAVVPKTDSAGAAVKAKGGGGVVAKEINGAKPAPSAIPVAVRVESGIKDAGVKQIGPLEKKIELLDKKLRDGKINRVKYEKLKAKYIGSEPKVEAASPPVPVAKVEARKPPMNCESCGKPPKFISKYKAWYCSSCKKYVVREVSSNSSK